MEKTGIIYKLTTKPHTGPRRVYVGQTARKTVAQRYRKGVDPRQSRLYNCLSSRLGRPAKTFADLMEVFDIEAREGVPVSELDSRERFAVLAYRAFDTEEGLNLTAGGAFYARGEMPASVRRRVSEGIRRHLRDNPRSSLSPEHRAKVSAALKGREFSPEHRARLGAKRSVVRKWAHQEHGVHECSARELSQKFQGLLSESGLSGVARGRLRQSRGWTCIPEVTK
jgi:hypothetical protein